MKRNHIAPIYALTLILLALVPGPPATAGALATALEETDVAVALRYRFENVSRNAADEKDAHASTLRTAVTVETGTYRRVKLFAEVENVAVLGNELFANRGAESLDNGVIDRSVVADVALTEFNQAYAEFGSGATRLRLGRQEILLSDVRFVGNVGWRQNHQSFDGVRLDHDFNDRVQATYAYIDNVRRIFGDSRGIAGHVAEVRLEVDPAALRAYALVLDWDDPGLSGLSTSTLGAELTGTKALDAWKLLYELEWATQSDSGDNPTTVEADYLHGMIGFGGAAATFRLGYEELEGSADRGSFSTPLATLHKFNGWADIFLSTPPAGLVDTYLQADGKQGSLSWLARYHDFESSSGSSSYGQEIDGQLAYQTSWKQTFALTLALYSADELSVDTDKWMVWTSYSF